MKSHTVLTVNLGLLTFTHDTYLVISGSDNYT